MYLFSTVYIPSAFEFSRGHFVGNWQSVTICPKLTRDNQSHVPKPLIQSFYSAFCSLILRKTLFVVSVVFSMIIIY